MATGPKKQEVEIGKKLDTEMQSLDVILAIGREMKFEIDPKKIDYARISNALLPINDILGKRC